MPQSYPLERRGRLQGFPCDPEVKILLSMQGFQAPFLVGELRSHMPWDVAKRQFFFFKRRGDHILIHNPHQLLVENCCLGKPYFSSASNLPCPKTEKAPGATESLSAGRCRQLETWAACMRMISADGMWMEQLQHLLQILRCFFINIHHYIKLNIYLVYLLSDSPARM